ncbi:MAG: hypothetical protein IJY67_08960 [Paludibacteraceae bacterium]|nr:hypothetical protein [Paludibacteraceae bacterium]
MDTDIAKSYDFQKFSKPIEEFYLFLQWQMDLYCLDGELANEYNRFLQQLYYIKLSEYLISGKRTLSNLSSINTIKDDIAVKDLINFQQELLNNLSEEEFQYIQYRRHSSAHISLDGYDLFYTNGNKRPEMQIYLKGSCSKVKMEREKINDYIDSILRQCDSDEKQFDITLTLRLHNIFIKHKTVLNYWTNIFIQYIENFHLSQNTK